MTTIKYTLPSALLISSSLLLGGCYEPSGQVPMAPAAGVSPDFAQQDVNAVVERRHETLYSPLSAQIPVECQSLQYHRFFPRGMGDAPVNEADAVVVLMPGMLGAANTFTGMAEQLVYQAHQKGHTVQVVALNRRNQCLADTTGLNAAERARDIQPAVDYYYNNATIDGRTFAGFKKGSETRFLTDFGVARAVEDMYQVAVSLVPDQRERQQKLYIGGHSLGGNLTSAFMGWDFDGDPRTDNDAGYRQAAGFVRLDISVTPQDESLDPFAQYARTTSAVDSAGATSKRYQNDIWKMRNGVTPRVVRLPGVDAETLALLDVAGMLAHWAPDQEHTLLKSQPIGATPALMLRLMHSADLNGFIRNSPNVRDFRFTNEALLGMILDDNFMPVKILQTSLGFLNGGRVTTKNFPNDPALIRLASAISPFFGHILTADTLYIGGDAGPSLQALGQGPLYGWTRFDQMGQGSYTSDDGSVSFTHARSEVTDIQDFARVLYAGESTFTEWYMPARLTLDFDYLGQNEPVSGLDFWHYRSARESRLLDIVGDESIPNLSVAPQGQLLVAEGYNHLDVTVAASDRSRLRSNPVIPAMLTFMLDIPPLED